MTYVVPQELKRLLEQENGDLVGLSWDALAKVLEVHEQMVREQVRREAADVPFGHEIRFFLHAGPAAVSGRRPHYFGAECTCRTWNSGLNALKWVLLGIQEHLAEHGLTWVVGNLTDGTEVQSELDGAREILAAARDALLEGGYFQPAEVDGSIAAGITQLVSRLRRQSAEELRGDPNVRSRTNDMTSSAGRQGRDVG